jgi:hypothetical protein
MGLGLMAMPKKGSRRICVDGVPYRWVGRNLTPVGGRIVVGAAERVGAGLVLRWDRDLAVAHVLPSQVAALIQQARAAG